MILKVALVFNHWGYSGIKVLALFVKQIFNTFVCLLDVPNKTFTIFCHLGGSAWLVTPEMLAGA